MLRNALNHYHKAEDEGEPECRKERNATVKKKNVERMTDRKEEEEEEESGTVTLRRSLSLQSFLSARTLRGCLYSHSACASEARKRRMRVRVRSRVSAGKREENIERKSDEERETGSYGWETAVHTVCRRRIGVLMMVWYGLNVGGVFPRS